MRDCVFLLADGQMEAVFRSFLQLPRFHVKLGTAPFLWDLVVAGQGTRQGPRNDPGVFQHAHLLLRGYRTTHRRAVVVLDFEWGHHYQVDEIKARIQRNLCQSGWCDDQIAVIVIKPELEAWLWQDHPIVQDVFYANRSKEERARLPSLRVWLRDHGLWPQEHPKPPDPKQAVRRARQEFGASSLFAIYTSICSKISVRGCQDQAFLELCSALRRWFPAAEGE